MADTEVTRETRAVSGFSGVTLGGIGRLRITQGDEERLAIEATQQMHERITSDVKEGVLTLGLRKGSWLAGMRSRDRRVLYELTMRNISAITLSGVGDIEAGPVRSKRLDLTVSGGGRLTIGNLSAEELIVVLSGAGSCEVRGHAESQDVTVSGAGSYTARSLANATAKALVSGTGDVTISVRDTLDATVSGVGSIECHGDPTVFRRVTGVGSITCVCNDGEESCPTEGGGQEE